MSKMEEELAELRAMEHEALAAEAYVLRERLRYIHRTAEAAMEKHRRGDRIALACEMHNLSVKCDLLPENREPSASPPQARTESEPDQETKEER